MTKKIVLFLSIFILSLFIRFWLFGENPTGFFCDEAAIGYNAYTLVKDGTDEYKIPLPLFFKSFGDYKNPVYIYSTVPFIFLFGETERAVRAVGASYGILTIVLFYFLGTVLFNRKVGLLASFLLTILPWHIQFSRVGFELISSVFWTAFLCFCLWKSLQKKQFYPLALVGFIMSFLSYHSPKLYLSFILLAFLAINIHRLKERLKDKMIWTTTIFFILLFFVIVGSSLTNKTIFARWEQFSHDKLTFNSMVKGYKNHFTLDFLFTEGDIDFPGQFVTRHSVRGMGELYIFQLPMILLGFGGLVFIKKWHKMFFFVFILLLLYPFGSVVTGIEPQATRSVMGIIPLTIFSAVGVYIMGKIIIQKWFKILFGFGASSIIALSLMHFLVLQNTYPLYSSDFWGWQYGPRDIMSYFLSHQGKYDDYYMQGEFNAPEIFLKFYDPKHVCKTCFIGSPKEHYDPSKRQLFAVTPAYLKESTLPLRIVNSIYYPNGSVAFHLVTQNLESGKYPPEADHPLDEKVGK